MRDKCITLVRKKPTQLLAAVFLFLLAIKLFRSLVLYEMPLGYDVGLYRYLFLKYASTPTLFDIPDLLPWEREHPPVLLYLVSLFVRAGLSVDWFIGFFWNLFSFSLIAVYARIIAKKYGNMVGVALIGLSLLSLAYFDGFAAMYWKSFAGLLCCILVFDSLEKKRWLLSGILIVVAAGTHHQTTLLMMLAIIPWWIYQGWQQRKNPKEWIMLTLLGIICVALSLLWYIHSIDFVIIQIKSIFLMARKVYGGAFPEPSFYVGRTCILIALGIGGFYEDWKRGNRWTLWQGALVWSAIFVFFKLHFYRRFYLHFDFFLLLFAAQYVVHLFTTHKDNLVRLVFCILLFLQSIIAINRMVSIVPTISSADFAIVKSLHTYIKPQTTVLVPENATAMWILGWMPNNTVYGPGLFGFDWTIENWRKFIYGSVEQRSALFSKIKGDSVLVAMPYFFRHYKLYADVFIQDPCLKPTENTRIFEVVCN